MIFAGIDVHIITHPKALAAGIDAFGLWCWGMCYAQLHITNGHLPRVAVLSALGGKRNIMLALKLEEAGLWTPHEDGSWSIWNYGKKNQTADEIREKKEKAAERVRLWRERRNAQCNASVTQPVTRNVRVRTDPQTQTPNTNRKQDLFGTASPEPEEVTKVRSRRKPETPCPESGASREAVELWAAGWKIPTGHPEFQRFLDHHRKGDARWRDWAAAWRTWLANATKFAARGGPVPRQQFAPGTSAPWMNPEAFDFGGDK